MRRISILIKKNVGKYKKFFVSNRDKNIFEIVSKLLENEEFLLMNQKGFESGKEMIFNAWFVENPIKVVVDNGRLYINDENILVNRRLASVIKDIVSKEE